MDTCADDDESDDRKYELLTELELCVCGPSVPDAEHATRPKVRKMPIIEKCFI